MVKPLTSRSLQNNNAIRKIWDASREVPDALHLEVGEPDADTPVWIGEAAKKAIDDGWTHYTQSAGIPSLRQEISRFISNRYQVNISTEQVVVGTGAVSVIAAAIAMIADIGEEVLIPDPGWSAYKQLINSQHSVPVSYRLLPDKGYTPDFHHLESLVTEKTKLMIINTPGNPTGCVYSQDTILAILAFAKKHDLYVLSDEIYDGVVFSEKKHVSALTFDEDERVIGIFGFSKNYAMTGWRVGYAITPTNLAVPLTTMLGQVISCVSGIVQKAAEEALRNPLSEAFMEDRRKTYEQRALKAYDIFVENDITAYKPEGAFYMLVDMSATGLHGMDLSYKLLEEEKVAVAPGSTFGKSTEKMIRLSLATKEEDVVEACKRICNFVKRYATLLAN